MSAEEQDASILRIVKGRAEAKRERALIASEITKMAETLYRAADSLRDKNLETVYDHPELYKRLVQQFESVSSEKLAQLLGQFAELSTKIREYDRTARELGID